MAEERDQSVSVLAGTRYGDLRRFADDFAESERLIVCVEAAEEPAFAIARALWRMRLAGWFDRASAVLVGRTHAPDCDGFTQLDAVQSALGDLGIPIVLDVDCRHAVPGLALINGAPTRVMVSKTRSTIEQHLS